MQTSVMLHRIALENFFSIADRQEINLKVPGNAPDLPCFRPSRAVAEQAARQSSDFLGRTFRQIDILRAVIAAAAFARESFTLPVGGPIPLFQPFMRRDWWGKPTVIVIDFDGQLAQINSQRSTLRATHRTWPRYSSRLSCRKNRSL